MRSLILTPGRRVLGTIGNGAGQVIQPVLRTGLDPADELIDPPMPHPQPAGSLIPSSGNVIQRQPIGHADTVLHDYDRSRPAEHQPSRPYRPRGADTQPAVERGAPRHDADLHTLPRPTLKEEPRRKLTS